LEALVHPFSFREYLRHAGREPRLAPECLPKAARSSLDRDLREYLAGGGFPEAQGVSSRDRFDLLRSYVDLALFRDVVERYEVSHPVALRWMSRHLLGNVAGHFSINKYSRDLRSQGIHVGKDTLHEYLNYLEDAFLIRTVSLESASARRRMVNPRKVYPVDPGLIPVFDRTGRANIGHALETCVELELERRGAGVSYVRTEDGLEVDFLARSPGDREELIQVCADLDDPAVKDREIRSLLGAAREYPRVSLHLISLQSEAARDIPSNITVHPAITWLLMNKLP
jgi:predicted AAA+ superfamily ATPase